jgi:hypothetical protein
MVTFAQNPIAQLATEPFFWVATVQEFPQKQNTAANCAKKAIREVGKCQKAAKYIIDN